MRLSPCILSIVVALFCFSVVEAHERHGELKFEENLGQMDDRALFRAKLPNGSVFLESNAITFHLEDPDETALVHQWHHRQISALPDSFHYHAFKIHLEGSQAPTAILPQSAFPDKVNYFYGNDPDGWVPDVRQYESILYKSVYPGIDFRVYSQGLSFKYEFILQPGADPDLIKLRYEGADDVLKGIDNLIIETSVQRLIDQKPVSWEVNANDQKTFVKSSFVLDKAGAEPLVSFEVERQDQGRVLVVDPTLIFSSYTGSTAWNWGFTATYDSLGNLYAGGAVFASPSTGYPTTTGAYQTSFGGGSGVGGGCDLAITKFNTTGNALVYSTYIGGSGNEVPHSLVVNDNNQLYILGTTGSSNYPTSGFTYDATFNGGSSYTGTNGITYSSGSDLFVTKLHLNGNSLIGSTYIGGNGNDGLNLNDTLINAYADESRGEIIVDGNDNCYVASTTSSTNFPIVNGYQNTYGGGETDAVIFKFNANLSNVIWSSYLGGSKSDGAYSLQFDPNLNVFVTGGTTSGNFPTTSTSLNPNHQGHADGFLVKLTSNGQNLLAGTYLGTSQYDQSYFVQLDLQGFVYVVGQTEGNYPIGPSWVYSNPGSGQFLHKLSNNLQSTVFSTRWGTGSGDVDISLTAFLVNQCNHIFVSGWGGPLNNLYSQSNSSTTTGLPVTSNAYQTTTDGKDFYFVVFEDSATSLLFASFFGGTTAGTIGEHVDGGTSRFDKKGIIYQAVCADCNTGLSGNTFPTTTGAYATSNGSVNCNLGAIKYDLVTLEAEASVDGPTVVCAFDTVNFANESVGGSLYYWEFGDGDTSSSFEPGHPYDSAGTYQVMLVIYDSVSCIAADTDYITIEVMPPPQALVFPVQKVCPDEPVQLGASGGDSYLWTPAAGLSDETIQNPIATVQNTTEFKVYVFDSCGVDSAVITVPIHSNNTGVMPDTALCKGQSGRLRAFGGLSYQWSPPFYLDGVTSPNPICEPDSTIEYFITIEDSNGCIREHDLKVFVEGFVPQVEATGDATICKGDRTLVSATGAPNYEWQPSQFVQNPAISSTSVFPDSTTQFIVKTENSCGIAFDTVLITVTSVNYSIMPDTTVCEGATVRLRADGALVYKWEGEAFLTPSFSKFPEILATKSVTNYLTVKSSKGCEDHDSVTIEVFPNPKAEILTQADTVTGLTKLLLIAQSTDSALAFWSPDGAVECATCDTNLVAPLLPTTYYYNVVDTNGCRAVDSITLKANNAIYVPNTFTPDGDGINDFFSIKSTNVLAFEIVIYNRWGKEIYRAKNKDFRWNGTFKGKPIPIGSYAYQITYTILPEKEEVQSGIVNLLR